MPLFAPLLILFPRSTSSHKAELHFSYSLPATSFRTLLTFRLFAVYLQHVNVAVPFQ